MRCELSLENLTVAMITRNEEQAIIKVIQDIRKVVPLAEILLVDSSQDQTAELAEKSGARVIKQYPPEGYGPAMYKALTSASGQVIVTLDCDDTYPTEKIPELAYSILEENFARTVGSIGESVAAGAIFTAPPSLSAPSQLLHAYLYLISFCTCIFAGTISSFSDTSEPIRVISLLQSHIFSDSVKS